MDDNKDQLVAGANTMLKIALQLVGKEAKVERNHSPEDTKPKDQDDKPDEQSN